MKTKKANILDRKSVPVELQFEDSRSEAPVQGGFRVRLDLHAGDWRCTSCSGQTMGSSLFKPTCEYCEKS